MEYAASRVSRFTLDAPATDLSQVSLSVYLNGEQIDRLPVEKISTEEKKYHLCLEEAEIQTDPALYTTQKTA